MGLSLLGLGTTGSATAGITPGTNGHHAAFPVVNLHKGDEARLRRSTQTYPVGVLYADGTQRIAGRGGNNCAEPHCSLDYNGGAVQHNPHVYLLLWGPNWSSDPNQEATASYLEKFYQGLGVAPQDNWSPTMSQYSDSNGHPTFGTSVFAGEWQDSTTPPTDVTEPELATEADTFASQQGITDLGDAQIVIATQSGICPAGFDGPDCSVSGTFCSWHDYSNEPFTVLPYVLDAGTTCGENDVNTDGPFDGFSIAASHEYADTITDPTLTTAWWDPDDRNGGEAADKCTWYNNADVSLSTGTFAMQPLWNNIAGGCVMPIGGTSDIVTVQPVPDQSTYQDSKLTFEVQGASTGKNPLTWTATGLPAGLSIDPNSGIISGQITAAPRTYHMTVKASDATGAFGWAPFTWQVKPDVGSAITNQGVGKCLNDHSYSISPGNSVVMWTCKTAANQQWSHPTNTGELIVLGQCLTDPGRGGSGVLQVIEPCTGAANQEWLHNSLHEYVVESKLLCLTDPNGATFNGAPLVVKSCTGAKNQLWTGA